MTTPTTGRSSTGRAPSGRGSLSIRDVGRALWSEGPAWRTRDGIARGVIRAAVLSLEVLAVAIVMGGVIGILRQVPSAGSFGALWLPGVAIAVFAGLAALMCLALASALLLHIRMSRDLDELRRLLAEAGVTRPSRQAGGNADEERRSAAA